MQIGTDENVQCFHWRGTLICPVLFNQTKYLSAGEFLTESGHKKKMETDLSGYMNTNCCSKDAAFFACCFMYLILQENMGSYVSFVAVIMLIYFFRRSGLPLRRRTHYEILIASRSEECFCFAEMLLRWVEEKISPFTIFLIKYGHFKKSL